MNTKTNDLAPNSLTAEQLQQRLFVKEQEVTSLKVQNRHLISKLEDAQKNAEEQINTQKISDEIQKTLHDCFDVIKTSMRGVYQQSLRAEEAVEEIKNHTIEIEARNNDQRKADKIYYQEKILNQITLFADRLERKLENRLKALAAVDLINQKQEEILSDIDEIKNIISTLAGKPADALNTIDNVAQIFTEVTKRKREAVLETEAQEKILRETQKQIEANAADVSSESEDSKITLDTL